MAHCKDKEDAVKGIRADDELRRLIRWGMHDWFSEAEPPRDVWPQILSRVQAMHVPSRHTPAKRRAAFSLLPLVQAVVASALVLAFGLGIDRNLTVPRLEQAVRSTPTVKAAVANARPDDMLRGYLLARKEQQPSVRQRPGGAQP